MFSRKTLSLLAALACLTLSATPALTQQRADVDRRVETILGQMTLEEKVDLLGGVDGFFIRGVPRLDVPRMKMADGPVGVRNFGRATAMPGGIALAATWDPELARRMGVEIGRDARAKGVHFLLGPGVNIYRAPMNGRNFEYFGEDPFLASRITVGYVDGVQSQGVSATIKHFIGNNSEFDRHQTDSVIDERTMREIYLPAFEAAVKEARVGAIMTAYNLTNGVYMSQHGYLISDVAKKDWGFDGIMMSDWTSTYDALGAANSGLDLEMPSGLFLNRQNLLPAVEQGTLTVATIDDKVRRILRTAIRFGWLDREQIDPSVPRYNLEGRRVALEAARDALVLLKNDGNVLPLDRGRTKTIAVIGPTAYPAVVAGGGSARVDPFTAVSLLEGLANAPNAPAVAYHQGIPAIDEMALATPLTTEPGGGEPGVRAEYFERLELEGSPYLTRVEPNINFGFGARPVSLPESARSERMTGYFTPRTAGDHDLAVYTSTGRNGFSYRLWVDDKLVLDQWDNALTFVNHVTLPLDARPHKIVLEHSGRSNWGAHRLAFGAVRRGAVVDPAAKALASKADAVVLAVGFDAMTEAEAADRGFRLPPGQDELIREIAAVNKNTVVVLTAGGSVDASAWVDRVPAILHAWYPGQEGGTALAEILLGDASPSGRLPISFERRWEDNPVHASYYPAPGTKQIPYTEGVFVGYRGYEKNGVAPLFPFGHGLSYTTFEYANLDVREVKGSDGPRFEVSFDVKNTGGREGAEVAQVYVGGTHAKVPRPAKELKGFAKVRLRPGETRRVTVPLDARSFAYYDAGAKRWHVEPGAYDVLVGRSVAEIALRGKAAVAGK